MNGINIFFRKYNFYMFNIKNVLLRVDVWFMYMYILIFDSFECRCVLYNYINNEYILKYVFVL